MVVVADMAVVPSDARALARMYCVEMLPPKIDCAEGASFRLSVSYANGFDNNDSGAMLPMT